MKAMISALLAALLACASLSATACPDQSKDDGKQMSTPSKPKT